MTPRESGQALSLRPAAPGDADLLLEWANDPEVRQASFASDPIDRRTHVAWLAARLADSSCRIWIGLEPSTARPIGVVRFERGSDGVATVSITIAPEARRLGLGQLLLVSGLAAARNALRPAGFRAWTRPDNARSLALFRAAGFAPIKSAGDRPRDGARTAPGRERVGLELA